MSPAFVTGGSGFLGRNLIAGLRARGVEVRALARSGMAAEAVRGAGAQPVSGDLEDDSALRSGMAGCSVVFHAAALVGDWGRRENFYRVNVAGTEHVIAVARAARVPRLVHVSTEAVLLGGPRIVNADESWPRPRHPLGFYALTKGLAEELVLAANSLELTTVVVRPRFIWGMGDTSVLPKLAQAVRAGKFFWIGGGRYLTSTCHVANACEGILLASERGRGSQMYFLTDGAPTEFRSFLTALLHTQGIDPRSRSLPRWLAWWMASVAEIAWRGFDLKGAPPITRMAVRLLGEEVTVNDAKARRELGYAGVLSREAGLLAMQRSR